MSGSIKRLTLMPPSWRRRMIAFKWSLFNATSSPPSVVSSCLFSGTIVATSGFISRAILTISCVAAISKLSFVFTISFNNRKSRSCICLLSSLRWTIIPSAPASSANTAAWIGSGSMPFRASLKVAIWSMLTASLANFIPSFNWTDCPFL